MTSASQPQNSDASIAWYKQIWPWVLIAIPFATVLAGVITYQIAANKPHSMVEDDYFKQGLAINQSIEKLEQAKKLEINAEIQFDQINQLLVLSVTANQPLAQTLALHFSHPTQANKDIKIAVSMLTNSKNRFEYAGQLPNFDNTNWYVRLTDQENRWLVKTIWNPSSENQLVLSAANDNAN